MVRCHLAVPPGDGTLGRGVVLVVFCQIQESCEPSLRDGPHGMLGKGVQLMKDRRGFQILDGFRQFPGKPTKLRASLAQGISYDTTESLPFLLCEQVGSTLASALKASEQRLSALLHDRSRIGRELHDSVLQALYAIAVSLAQSPELRRDAPPDLTGCH